MKNGFYSVTKDLSSFLEIKHEGKSALLHNNNLFQELRMWALENLEILNLKKISLKINKLLESSIKNNSLLSLACNIAYLVKESSIQQWIDDLSFLYCPVKKSCIINIHKREDSRVDRKNTQLRILSMS